MSTTADTAKPAQAARHRSPMGRIVSEFARSRLALAGLGGLLVVSAIAILAPWIAPQDPYDLTQIDILDGMLPPGSEGFSGMTHLLGTDQQGRDLLSAIFYGLRISLLVGISSAVVAVLAGASLGLLAAYIGGRFENFVMRLVDLQLSFPTILVALMILAFIGRGVGNVIVALIIVEWATYARTARGSALAEIRKEYIEAAESLSIPTWRVVFRHLLPNCLPPLLVIATVQIARAITLEATLSFLGLGVPVTEPSLGMLISNGYQHMMSGDHWLSLYPGIALLFTIVSINLVGDRLRDVMNPRSR